MPTPTFLNSMRLNQHQGFTLVELMIAILLGTVALGSLLVVFGSSAKANIESIRTAKLNQEIRSIMDVMSRDIRRAGYWADAAKTPDATNPFGIIQMQDNCITYSYDKNDDGVLDLPSETFGFRLNGKAIEMPSNKFDCDDTHWEDATDLDISSVTNTLSGSTKLTEPLFSKTTQCVNLTNPSQLKCNGAVEDDVLLIKTEITISLTGHLKADPVTQFTIRNKIKIRNDKRLIRPPTIPGQHHDPF